LPPHNTRLDSAKFQLLDPLDLLNSF